MVHVSAVDELRLAGAQSPVASEYVPAKAVEYWML